MLKEWLLSDGKLDSITIEEKFTKWVEQLRTDKYVTATQMQYKLIFPCPTTMPRSIVFLCVGGKSFQAQGVKCCPGDKVAALQDLWEEQGGQVFHRRASERHLGYYYKSTSLIDML